MRLEFESNTSALPVTDAVNENQSGDNGSGAREMLREGIKAAQAGNRSEARHLLLRVTELDPSNENAWLWLASISEYPEELLVFLKNVLEINPDNQRAIEWTKATKSLLAKTFVQRGIDAAKDDQKDFANQCFNHAIAQDEHNEMAWLWMASITDSDEEKIGFLEKALSIDPENQDAKAGLAAVSESRLEAAYTAAAQGDTDRANELLDLVLRRVPESEEAWILRSDLLEDTSAKISILEKVLTINPENAEAREALDEVHNAVTLQQFHFAKEAVESGDNETAYSLLNEVLSKKPGMVEGWLLKAQAVTDRTEKTAIFDKVLTLDPGNAEARDGLAAVESESVRGRLQAANAAAIKGGREKANKLLSELLADHPEMEEAWVLKSHLAENFDEKIAAFEKVLEIAPDNVVARAGLESLQAIMSSAAPDVEEPVIAGQPNSKVAEDRSPTQDLVYPEEMVENNPFESSHDEAAVQPVEAPVEASSAGDDPWPTEEDLSIASEDISPDAPEYGEETVEQEYSAFSDVEEIDEQFTPSPQTALCPYCEAENEQQAYQCDSCDAMLSLSDIEMLLAHPDADKQILEFAVGQMEAEKAQREFSVEELKVLGIGYINLKDLKRGLDCLQEAQRKNPNDVILGGQVNALGIRFAEIREQEEANDAMPKCKKILVVDDSATVRKLIAGKLEKCGHVVICAVDGVDALEKIEEFVPDLVLLDINMPRMDGYQVCKLIRNNHATENVPVVMISGKDGFFDKVRGRMSGTTGYITKPFGPETLMKALETYIVNEDIEPAMAEE